MTPGAGRDAEAEGITGAGVFQIRAAARRDASNANPILTEVGSFPIQDRPRRVLAGRVVRLGLQVSY